MLKVRAFFFASYEGCIWPAPVQSHEQSYIPWVHVSSSHAKTKQIKLGFDYTGRRHIHNALFLWYFIASGLWYAEYPQNTESLWISISSERVLTSRALSYTRRNSVQGTPQVCMPPQPNQTWSKVWSQWCNIFFYLKSVLENAHLGGSTMRGHFAYYTQGCAAAHKHGKC